LNRRDDVLIRLAGPFSVTRDGTPYGKGVIGGKARTLLKLLAVERGRTVEIDRIVEVLWNGDPPKRPADNVATLVSRLRRTLGSGSIAGGREGYRLGIAPAVNVDLDDAATLIAEAERLLTGDEPAIAGAAAARALELLNAGFVLEDESSAHWARPARDEVTGLLRRARHTAAAAALATAEPDDARRVAEAAVAADPFDEAAHRLLMRAHDAAGDSAQALMVYERLRRTLVVELGTDPAPQTRAVHLAILRERPPYPLRSVPKSVPVTYPVLVGRDAEVARIEQAWKAATAGEMSALVIAGEAGIGKSRLAAEAIRMAESTGGLIMRAQCYEAERSLFLQPIVDAVTPQVTSLAGAILRGVTGERAATLAALVPEVASVLGSLPEDPRSVEVERGRLYDAVAVFLRGLAARRPILLALDDLHNAGRATVELIHYLCRRITDVRLLIVVTVCTEEGADTFQALDGVMSRLDLGSLPQEAVTQLATAKDQEAMADQIFRRTRGHPFFVVEMLRGLADGESGVSESLRNWIVARVRRLGERAARTLRAAAVLDSAFEPGTLGEMVDFSPQEAAYYCEQALAARLLVVTHREYEFANDFIREALYTATPTPTRLVQRHRAAALLGRRIEPVEAWPAAAADRRSQRSEPCGWPWM
jgi:DNA-binding SARP family transcriptional activator